MFLSMGQKKKTYLSFHAFFSFSLKYVVILFLRVRHSTLHSFTETHVKIILGKYFPTQNSVL